MTSPLPGAAPQVTLEPNGVTAHAGHIVTVYPTISDADNHTETSDMTGKTGTGLEVHEVSTTTYFDRPQVSWSWRSNGKIFGAGTSPLSIPTPAQSDILDCHVVDEQGHTALASCTFSVIPDSLVGIDPQGVGATAADVTAHIGPGGLFAGLKGGVKLFWKPGAGLPTLTGVTLLVPFTAIPVLAFQDMPTKEQWTAWLDQFDGPLMHWREIWPVWKQEGDRTTAPADFVAGWEQLIGWSAGHRNRGLVKLLPNLTWYWQRYHNGDNYAEFIPKGADGLAVDLYPSGTHNYLAPTECLRAPLAAARAADLTLYILECGVVVPANPTTADYQQRADWYSGVIGGCYDEGVAAISIWCAAGDQAVGTGGFHMLRGQPDYQVVRGYTQA